MKKGIYCSLDIGNSKLTAVIAKLDSRSFLILDSEVLPVKGLSKGVVKDLVSLTDCIQQIIVKLSKKTKLDIKKISISVNGLYINARLSFAAFALSDRANRHINFSDINFLRCQARLLGLNIDESLLHEFPQGYILDDFHYTFKPLGLLARKVQLNSYLLSAPHALLGNIKTAVKQAGYEIDNIVYSGVASSFSVLSEKERKEGVILIDLGACFTSILFFKDEILRDFKIISFGGNDITTDISNRIGISWDLAEEIKKTSLILSITDYKSTDTIVIKRSGSYRTLQKKELYESIRDRIEEFLDNLKQYIDSSAWKDKMKHGIVSIGGTSKLEGLLEKIESHTGLQVRLGLANDITVPQHIAGPEYAAAVGLIYYAHNSKGMLKIKDCFTGKTMFEKAANFFHYLYREYF